MKVLCLRSPMCNEMRSSANLTLQLTKSMRHEICDCRSYCFVYSVSTMDKQVRHRGKKKVRAWEGKIRAQRDHTWGVREEGTAMSANHMELSRWRCTVQRFSIHS